MTYLVLSCWQEECRPDGYCLVTRIVSLLPKAVKAEEIFSRQNQPIILIFAYVLFKSCKLVNIFQLHLTLMYFKVTQQSHKFQITI